MSLYSNALQRSTLNLIRGQMLSGLLSQYGMGASLTDLVLNRHPATRSGREIMESALTGLSRSDAGMLRQASKNVSEASSLLKEAASGVAGIKDRLERMKTLAEKVQANEMDLGVAQSEYGDLLSGLSGIVKGSRYNGISLMNGPDWTGDERVGFNSGDLAGKLQIQAGNDQSQLSLYDLSSLPGDLAGLDLTDSATTDLLSSKLGTISSLKQSYEARAGLYESEAAAFKNQAKILDEAAQRAINSGKTHSRDLELLNMLLSEQGNLFNGTS